MLKHREKIKKIIASIMILITCTFAVPNFSQADFGGKLFSPLVNLFAGLGDVVIGGLQHWMLGTSSLWSATLRYDDPNVEEWTDRILVDKTSTSAMTVTVAGKNLDRGFWPLDGKYDDINVPNIIYCPELIFSNLVPALDINFLNPDTSRFQAVEVGGEVPISSATQLHEVVAAWYTAFRNIALVGLLSVLVYIGIRIVISSSAGEKAKYQERITDWLVALCLLFVIHYIMSFTINITQQITTIFSGAQTIDVIVKDTKVVSSADASSSEENSTNTDKNVDFAFTTNLMGYMRFMVYMEDLLEKCAYLIIYLVLVVYTVMFTFIYLRRVLYMAFFTMIAPLVALTYPLDKLSDGKAQAFNLWIREYIFNALIQPMHLALYTMLMSSSMYLATTNPIYALVAVGFLFPAEKFVKKMFGFNKADTAGGGAGSFAGGALTMAMINRMRSNASKKSHDSESSSTGDYIDKGVDYTAFANRSPSALIGNGGGGGQPSPSPSGGGGGQPSPSQSGRSGGQPSPSSNGNALNLNNGDRGNGDYEQGSVEMPIGELPPSQDNSVEYNMSDETFDSDRAVLDQDQNQSTDPLDMNQYDSIDLSANSENRQQPQTPSLTRAQRAGRIAKYIGHNAKRTLTNAPKTLGKKAGKFALKYGVAGLKGAAGAAIAAIPAGVTLLASGGDFSTAGKIIAAGAGAGAMIGPSGEEIANKIQNTGRNLAAAGRTPEEQKNVEADRKVRELINNKKQMQQLQKVLNKDGVIDQRTGTRMLAEDWVKQNRQEAVNFAKNGSKNLATMYRVNKLANENPQNRWSDDYKYNMAKLYDNVGKRINDDSYMESFDAQMVKNGVTGQALTNVRNDLRKVDY